MRFPPFGVLARWVAAVLIGGGGVALLARVMENETNWVAVFGKSLYGIAAMLTGVLLVAPEVVGWAVLPIHRWLDSLLLPSESEPPPADYTLARFYATRMRYEEACEEYSKIIRYHPEESVAYLEGIRAASLAGDRKLAASFHRKGRRALRSPDERRLLDNVYGAQHKLVGLSHGETGADGNSEVAVGSE